MFFIYFPVNYFLYLNSLSIYLYLSIYFYIYLFTHTSVFSYIHLSMYIYLFFHLPISEWPAKSLTSSVFSLSSGLRGRRRRVSIPSSCVSVCAGRARVRWVSSSLVGPDMAGLGCVPGSMEAPFKGNNHTSEIVMMYNNNRGCP